MTKNENLLTIMDAAKNVKSKRKVTPNKNESSKAPKLSTTSKETLVDLKSMKKIDLIQYCENILIRNQELIEDNKNLLKLKVKQADEIALLQKNNAELKEKCSNTPVYLCGDCDYLAECIHDFNDHTHSPEDFNDSDISNEITSAT